MANSNISFFRTDQLNEKQWISYTRNFNKVFNRNFTIEYFTKKYYGSCLGYSFHGALMNTNGEIVGMYSAIPRTYAFCGKEEIIVQGCDAFVLAEYRKDEFILKNLSEAVISNLLDIGIHFHISLPNPTAYPYWKHFCGWQEITKLDYYIVPVKVGKVLGKWNFLNVLSSFSFKLAALTDSLIFHSGKAEKKQIHLKISSDFIEQRFDDYYKKINTQNSNGFVYREYDEDGIKAVYLIDCFDKSQKNLANAVRHILLDKYCNPDIIIYIGKTRNLPWYMIKVPYQKEPRHQPFIGLFAGNVSSEAFLSPESWDINLANFDNR